MIWVLLVLGVAIVVLPLAAHARRYKVDAVRRRQAPGEFADLPTGKTHYRWSGPETGPVAVCVHGLTTPSYAWAGIAQGLNVMGFRVLTYDLYGRGFSDLPRGAQSKAFFLAQLEALLADQGVEEIDVLLGYSMGGSIVTFYAQAHPERVKRLVVLASAGLGHTAGRLADFVRRTPPVGDWLMQVLGGAYFGRSTGARNAAIAVMPDIEQWHRPESQRRGFVQAVLSSHRHMLMQSTLQAHAKLAAAQVPVLAIWAEEDQSIPATALGKLAEVNRDAHQDVIKGATHGLPYSHPRDVLRVLEAFLRLH